MAVVQVKELVEAGVHFGHRSSKWNPKMRPFIYGKRNLIHIIDLRETVRGLLRAQRFLARIVSQGSLVLFVGAKRQAQETITREASRVSMPFVGERWIGGTFTNFRTIRERLKRLEELERLMETGEITAYSKKRRSTLLREMKKIHRNLAGVRTMNRLPGAMFVVDPKTEASAVKEARAMGIPVVALIDTDSDPETVDLAIPGNDDSIRAVELIVGRLADAVAEGVAALAPDAQHKLQFEFKRAHSAITPTQAQAKLVAHELPGMEHGPNPPPAPPPVVAEAAAPPAHADSAAHVAVPTTHADAPPHAAEAPHAAAPPAPVAG